MYFVCSIELNTYHFHNDIILLLRPEYILQGFAFVFKLRLLLFTKINMNLKKKRIGLWSSKMTLFTKINMNLKEKRIGLWSSKMTLSWKRPIEPECFYQLWNYALTLRLVLYINKEYTKCDLNSWAFRAFFLPGDTWLFL